jgi:putative redox protein
MDASPPDGDGSAASPRETVLAALAGCTAMDVATLLRKKRQRPIDYEIDVTGSTASGHPQVFTEIVVVHRLRGDVDAEALRRSIELSATRYCPVSAMLSAVARVEHRYVLEQDGAAPIEALVAVLGPPQQPTR